MCAGDAFVQTTLLPVNVSLPVKNKVAGTKYRLTLNALCDLLEILSTVAAEASGRSG